MGSRSALVLLTVLCPLLLVGLVVDLANGFWTTIPAICGLPFLLVAVATRPGRPSRGFLVLVWLLLTSAWLGLWWLSRAVDLRAPRAFDAAVVLGVMLIAIGLLPLVLVGVVHARTWSGSRAREER